MLSLHTILLALVSSVAALPATTPTAVTPPQNASIASTAPKIPLNGLTDPATISPSVSLAYVALGIGHQNYTCGSDQTLAPVSIGAVATLFDVTALFKQMPVLITTLPALALSLSTFLNLDSVSARTPAALSATSGDFSLPSPPGYGLRPLGVHYFHSPENLPTFDLFNANPPMKIEAKKLAAQAAPPGSPAGKNGMGSVAWLQLGDAGLPLSYGGLKYVYRVQTAGGNPPATCNGVADGSVVRVPYVAEYWLYKG